MKTLRSSCRGVDLERTPNGVITHQSDADPSYLSGFTNKNRRETILQVANPDAEDIINSEEYNRYAAFDIHKALLEIPIIFGYDQVSMLSQNKISEVHKLKHKNAKTKGYVALKIIDLTDFTDMQI